MDQPNSTATTSNFSSPALLPHPSLDLNSLLAAVMMSFCFILGVPGNIAVIILRPNWQRVSSLSQSLLLNLAVSDLLCLLTLPLWIHTFLNGWTFGLIACKVSAFVGYSSVYSSLMNVTGLSIQRYLTVVHRKSFQQLQRRLILVPLWMAALILSIPYLVVQQLVPDQQWMNCRARYSSEAQRMAVLMTETVFGFIFFVIVAFSYICLKRTVEQGAFFNNPQTTRLVTSIIVSFFILWAPYHIINVMSMAASWVNDENLSTFCTYTMKIAVSLTFVNSCLNPLLYAFTTCKVCRVSEKKELPQDTLRMPQTSVIASTAEVSG